MDVLMFAVVLQVSSGIIAFLLSRCPRAATVVGATGVVAGGLLGLVPTLRSLLGGGTESLHLYWDATHGDFIVGLDNLSAFFLVPVFALSALAAVYGGNYLLSYRNKKTLGRPWFFFNLFVSGMVMVLTARTVLLFLMAWEVMSISAYCLVTFEHEKAEVRKAGWIYLIATHLGVICLFIAFLLLGGHAGSLEFRAFNIIPSLDATTCNVIFILASIGFGAKAGFVPFHVWLPEAHPAAPSHVSALMSGVMIKMGIYGLLRILAFLGEPPPWWGLSLAGLGLLTCLVGISLAMYQRDVKRILAYSSIENMGLIALALGVGQWGRASDLPAVAVLGTLAALLHVWNHSLMKGLMFFTAGSVLHATGERDIEKMGGLMKLMPWTGIAMLFGAVAISALPPLNGFISKWLIYKTLLENGLNSSGSVSLIALFVAGLLALIGTLAGITFVRLSGIVLLGSARSELAQRAHESSPWMVGPMLVIVFLCLIAALLPQWVADVTLGTLNQILAPAVDYTAADLEGFGARLYVLANLNGSLVLVAVALAIVLLWAVHIRFWTKGATWACGYTKATVRMQYTGRSFTDMCAGQLLPQSFRPRTNGKSLNGLFPSSVEFESRYEDPISANVYEPFFSKWADRFAQLRILQQGKVHVYLLYIMFAVVLALAWTSLRMWPWGTT